jgi:thiamine biosynthesis protein ThiS
MIEIRVNGEARQVAGGSVQEVLSQLAIEARALLVEHNGVALHRSEWTERSVCAGDALELVRIVAGG